MNDVQSTLDTITAAVEGMCACGCGAQLNPNGSMWYATPECQWEFQQQHADDPDDVYNRPDATVGLAADMTREMLRQHEGELRRAYLDAPPSAHAPRRGRAFRDAFGQPGDRVRYQHLTPDEREAVHAWVELHDVDHTTVPIDARFELDEATNEWLIPVYAQRDGCPYLGEDGEVVTEVLRRPNRAESPWPRVQAEPEVRVPSAQNPVYEFANGTRLWTNNEEVTEHVRSIQLDSVIEDTSSGDTAWREYIGGLRSGSLTIGGNWDWMANETITVPSEQVERGHIATWDETHEWVGGQAHERFTRMLGPELATGGLVDPNRIYRIGESGRDLRGQRVADWAESQGLQLEPWQRQMLDAVYSTPQPRLFGRRGVLTSEMLNAAEDRVRHSYGGEAGNILGTPIISSPFVPEGEAYLVNQRPSRFRFDSEPMRFDQNALRWRMWAHMMPPPQCGDLLVFGNHYSYCREHVPDRRRGRGAGYTAPRNNPRLRALHIHYRQRCLARQRRRRNR